MQIKFENPKLKQSQLVDQLRYSIIIFIEIETI